MISPIALMPRDDFIILPCQSSNHFNDFFSDFKGCILVFVTKGVNYEVHTFSSDWFLTVCNGAALFQGV